MRLLVIADVFPPLRSSGAVQLRDLCAEFVRQGHDTTVLVASPDLAQPWRIDVWNGVRVARLRTPRTKDVGYLRRAFGECLMSFAMLWRLRGSALRGETWDGVVWYSPTIFLGPVARAMKSRSRCRGYLIVRDIFPEWALDMGIMGRGVPYAFFRVVADYQYRVADVIGVQAPGNLAFFGKWRHRPAQRVEVLHNWLAAAPDRGCGISLARTPLAGRSILVYAGNMGVAQGTGALLDLAALLRSRTDIGFVFVGRGSDAARLRHDASARQLDNVLFFDEIDPDEIPGLYSQCRAGIVALDPRHRTHNIPGKFLSYMQAGLPVLAVLNSGNDLVDLIRAERVGVACTEARPELLHAAVGQLLEGLRTDPDMASRCRSLWSRMFSAAGAARQIVAALQS